MPQMYPMNWILMSIIFIMIFSFTSNKIFYFKNTLLSSSKSSSFSKVNLLSKIWKW